MSQQAVGERVYGGEMEAPECPDEAEYTLMFMGIREITMGRSFDGKPPQEQLILDFKIDAENPQPGSLQAEWHHFDLKGYFTPILHYGPNLPDWGGRKYTEPSLYLLARALNGGTPLDLPSATSETSGKSYYIGYNANRAAELIEPFIDKRFRVVVGPNDSGWPRFKSPPMPLVAAGTRRRGQAQTTLNEAAPAADDGAEMFEGDSDL